MYKDEILKHLKEVDDCLHDDIKEALDEIQSSKDADLAPEKSDLAIRDNLERAKELIKEAHDIIYKTGF